MQWYQGVGQRRTDERRIKVKRIICRKDIQVYKVVTGEYRAYVKGEANLEAWGYSEENAILNLGKALNKKTSYGFDLFS